MGRRSRPETFVDVPLFDVIPVAVPAKPPAPRSVAQGYCPSHKSNGRTTGLVQSGGHLYWREHPVATYGGSRVCAASGQRLCDRPTHRGDPVCICQDGVPRSVAGDG